MICLLFRSTATLPGEHSNKLKTAKAPVKLKSFIPQNKSKIIFEKNRSELSHIVIEKHVPKSQLKETTDKSVNTSKPVKELSAIKAESVTVISTTSGPVNVSPISTSKVKLKRKSFEAVVSPTTTTTNTTAQVQIYNPIFFRHMGANFFSRNQKVFTEIFHVTESFFT